MRRLHLITPTYPTFTVSSGTRVVTLNEAAEQTAGGTYPLGPAAPTGLRASAGDGSLGLAWTAPTNTNGYSITNYLVQYTPSGGSAQYVLTNSSSPTYTLTGLTNGTAYTVSVAAVTFRAGAWSSSATGTPVARNRVWAAFNWGNKSANTSCFTSADAITWTQRYVAPQSGTWATSWSNVLFANNNWVAIANGSNNYNQNSTLSATSADGITWTTRTNLPSTGMCPLAYGNGQWITAREYLNGAIAASTDNGVTWSTKTTTGLPTNYWPASYGLAYGAGLFVMLDQYTPNNYFYTSADGASWTARPAFSTNYQWRLKFLNGKFFALVYNMPTSAVWSSTDGINWTSSSLTASKYWADIAYNGSTYLIISSNQIGSSLYNTSSDGTSWSGSTMSATITTNARYAPLSYGAGVFAATGTNGIFTSTDGATWTQRSSLGGYLSSYG